jgi:predicted acetyltransferase
MDVIGTAITVATGQHTVAVTVATDCDQTIVRNLMHLYLYDFSVYTGDDPDADGWFSDEHLAAYWTEHGRRAEGRMPWLIRVDGAIAGFALIKRPHADTYAADHDVAEFFIMRKWRRCGIGSAVAAALFAHYPGVWEVKVIRENEPALAFWRSVIGSCTGLPYRLVDARDGYWDGWVFVFCH